MNFSSKCSNLRMVLKAPLIVKFMYQYAWARVPRYLVKYYSGYFWQGVSISMINI